MLAMLEADAQGQLVSAQRQIKGAEYFQIVVIADRAGYEPFERATGIRSDNVERAACGVASEQCALWPARSEEHTSALQSLMRISYAVFCLNTKKKSPHISQTLSKTNK